MLRDRLEALVGHGVLRVRTRGCGPASTSTPPSAPVARSARRSWARGVLAKDTHGSTIRLAPPLVITAEDLAWGLDQLAEVVRAADPS